MPMQYSLNFAHYRLPNQRDYRATRLRANCRATVARLWRGCGAAVARY